MHNIVVMTSTSAPAVEVETRAALLAYLDALILAEPIHERLWQRAHITLPQLTVLRELRTGPQGAGKLGGAVGVSPTSLTRLVDRLERRGLVSRRRDVDDRRCVEIRLEAAGERLLGQLRVLRGSDVQVAVESMTCEERRRLTRALRGLDQRTRAVATSEAAAR